MQRSKAENLIVLLATNFLYFKNVAQLSLLNEKINIYYMVQPSSIWEQNRALSVNASSQQYTDLQSQFRSLRNGKISSVCFETSEHSVQAADDDSKLTLKAF